MLIKYSYIKYVPVTQITKCLSCTEKFCPSYRTIPLILYLQYFLFADAFLTVTDLHTGIHLCTWSDIETTYRNLDSILTYKHEP